MDDDWLGLKGRPALVVGAGGIGSATAVGLARAGARVAVVDHDEAQLSSIACAADRAGVCLETVQADVGTAVSARAAVETATQLIGRPEVFVHAVGRNKRQPVLELTDEDWNDVITLNLSSAWWLGQAVARGMVEAGHGRIVYLSSVSGMLAHLNHAPYAASKGGVNQLARGMAREWASCGVTVNAVAPGYIETDLTRDYLETDGHRAELEALVPAGRLGRPDDVADTILFLVSHRAAFITGQVVYVDGGRVLV